MLVDHQGRRNSLEEVYAVPKVQRTSTWNPIHHKELDISLRNALNQWDYEIMGAEYSMNESGMRLFAVYQLRAIDEDRAFSLGMRNAMDKSMAIGITAGIKIFVCTNLAFSGEFLQFRKHTGLLDLEEIRSIAGNAVQQIGGNLEGFSKWHEKLHDYSLTRSDMEALTFRAIENKVLPAGKFGRFHDLFFKKDSIGDYDNDLYGFHGAMTELQRENSLIGAGKWNKELNKLLDSAIVDIKDYSFINN